MSESAEMYVEDKTISEIFFKLNGRLNRLRYFKRKFVLGVLLTMLLHLGYRIFGYEFGQVTTPYAAIYNTIISLIFIIPNYCLSVRRLQDMNRGKTLAIISAILSAIMAFQDFTGLNYKFYFLLILATATLAIGAYILVVPGTRGKNRYGASPIPI